MTTATRWLVLLFCCLPFLVAASPIKVYGTTDHPTRQLALRKLAAAINFTAYPLSDYTESGADLTNIFLLEASVDKTWYEEHNLAVNDLVPEGFQILRKGKLIYLVGGDETGILYGVHHLRDHYRLHGNFNQIAPIVEAPHLSFRAIKFNLPWSSYRHGASLQLHYNTVRDTAYWEAFLDMMVENRFNALTLWNLHPYTFMIQPTGYPEAIQFTGQEFADWQQFWRTLFRMAKDRGIATYLLNWNIITSPGFTAAHDVANYKDDLEWHYGFTPADTSQIIVDYMRQCITQTINEYPNLTGVGVSIGERMKMPIEAAMEWVKATFVAGIMEANRPARFIHRAPFSVEPEAARAYIESYQDFPDPIIMEFKYNWSHGHSSPKLWITHGGRIADQYWNPRPSNYQMAWTMRNEDFLMLNWGHADFIRQHIRANNHPGVVAGYFIGSETFIPAKEYRLKNETPHEWTYAFEKQWQFYQYWGRLLYNPATPDEFFIKQHRLKYGEAAAPQLFKALELASEMPLALASFYQGTWDFTLYCEGFLNGKQIYRNYHEAGEAFISLQEMITHPTLDKRYLNIRDFTKRQLTNVTILATEITPLDLAEKMSRNGDSILAICQHLEEINFSTPNAQIEKNDLLAWAYLSHYFSAKLRAGVYLDRAIHTKDKALQEQAVQTLKQAAGHWRSLVNATQQYAEVPLLHIRSYLFSWDYFYPKVLKDIEYARSVL